MASLHRVLVHLSDPNSPKVSDSVATGNRMPPAENAVHAENVENAVHAKAVVVVVAVSEVVK
jgi:hypothetical protein